MKINDVLGNCILFDNEEKSMSNLDNYDPRGYYQTFLKYVNEIQNGAFLDQIFCKHQFGF